MSDIVVVDDDRLMIQLIVSVLEDEGHVVRAAASGEAGLAEIARQRPDILVLDMKMPGMSGIEVARALRAGSETCALPIIALSGSESAQEEAEALSAGCTVFVQKRDLSRLIKVAQDIL
ncbi:Response regulator receiver domain protein (CheY) [Magnetospirillum sp. LM-5]|uniref:response regulator n=1 Tax=Magnetospirillum sp. LM-5 TaxID=2681466 RepID=UPI00137EDC2A|nr:response regulator [Magnetospirillum sp. LM-5]CAA7622183.1 Response regulator receiver domain protein (CheY) [Magnetospirillum sp. LM-5]